MTKAKAKNPCHICINRECKHRKKITFNDVLKKFKPCKHGFISGIKESKTE